MIPANELMIGNYLYWKEADATFFKGQVFRVEPSMMADPVFYEDLEQEHIGAVPLLPEILSACGFEEIRYPFGRAFLLGRFCYLFQDKRLEIGVGDVGSIEVPMEHLHRLQNLYFSLEGKELEVIL